MVSTENKRITIKVNTAHTITTGPTNHVSETGLFRIEEVSLTKCSVIVNHKFPNNH